MHRTEVYPSQPSSLRGARQCGHPASLPREALCGALPDSAIHGISGSSPGFRSYRQRTLFLEMLREEGRAQRHPYLPYGPKPDSWGIWAPWVTQKDHVRVLR